MAADVANLQVRGRFSVVCLFDCLEHVPVARHPNVLQSIAQCSTDNAKLLVTIPAMHVSEYLRNHRPESRQVVDETVDPIPLQQRLAAAGFRILSMEHYGVEFQDEYVCLVTQRVSASAAPLPVPPPGIGRLVWHGIRLPFRTVATFVRRRRYAGTKLLSSAREAVRSDSRAEGRSFHIHRGGRPGRRHHRSPHP